MGHAASHAGTSLAIACAQVNPRVGDIAGNAALVRRLRNEAAAQQADLVVFPELVLVGYPPEDLVLRPALVEAAACALTTLVYENTDELLTVHPAAAGIQLDLAAQTGPIPVHPGAERALETLGD